MSAKPFLRRREVPGYVLERWNQQVSPKTLDKWATIGGGPPFKHFGKAAVYAPDDIDAWVLQRLAAPRPPRKVKAQSPETSEAKPAA